MFNRIKAQLGRWLADYLSRPAGGAPRPHHVDDPRAVAAVLAKGDILLVSGGTRFGASIRYLTRSNWSHSALCVGDVLGAPAAGEEPRVLVESDVKEGIRAVPLSAYAGLPVRICRAEGLTAAEIDRVVAHAVARLGHRYDLKHVFDLLRFLIRKPPVPDQWKRNLLELGSGDPTRAICSTLIAEAFQSVRYPILPLLEPADDGDAPLWRRAVFHPRRPSLFTPADFDLSPWFQIVKPTLAQGFDPHGLRWEGEAAAVSPP